MSGSVDVLAVMDDEIASLPVMAELASSGGCHCDAIPAIDRMTEARAAVAELIEACGALPDHRFAQVITFEGSPYVLVSPDDYDAMFAALSNVTGGAS